MTFVTLRRPRLVAPPGACDCHLHIYEPQYPLAPTAIAAAPLGSLADYRAVQERLGLTRAVVVQPTAYGADNSCTLAAVAAMGDKARGVAMITADTGEAEFERLDDGGIRGFRFRTFPGGVLAWRDLERAAAAASEFGWHVDVEMDGRTLPDHELRLRGLPNTLVIDHIGKFLEPVTFDHPGVRALFRLIEAGNVYVKLASPYDSSRAGHPRYADLHQLVRALVRIAPDRLIWATNWPHAALPRDNLPDDADFLDLLLDWAPEEATRRKILVDNPVRLYGF
jgi:D-galactarolactone isomerase